MEVCMLHYLACNLAVVHQDIVCSVSNRQRKGSGDFLRSFHQQSQLFIWNVKQGFEMLSGYNQAMPLVCRSYVKEGYCILVFIHFCGRYFSLHDFAENAVFHFTSQYISCPNWLNRE